MIDEIDVTNCLRNSLLVSDVTVDKGEVGVISHIGQVLLSPGRKVVQAAYSNAAVEQSADEV